MGIQIFFTQILFLETFRLFDEFYFKFFNNLFLYLMNDK